MDSSLTCVCVCVCVSHAGPGCCSGGGAVCGCPGPAQHRNRKAHGTPSCTLQLCNAISNLPYESHAFVSICMCVSLCSQNIFFSYQALEDTEGAQLASLKRQQQQQLQQQQEALDDPTHIGTLRDQVRRRRVFDTHTHTHTNTHTHTHKEAGLWGTRTAECVRSHHHHLHG